MVPLGQVAQLVIRKGPPAIRTENAMLSALRLRGHPRSRHRRLRRGRAASRGEQVKLPPGYYLAWSGQFEYMERAMERLKVVVPLTLLIVFLLLYLNFQRMVEKLIVMLSVPFSLVGGVWLLYALDYNLSVAVGVGFIALAGVEAETGVVMLIYLNKALEEHRARCCRKGGPKPEDLREAIVEGAVKRVRPKMMTVVAIMTGLLPIMWSTARAPRSCGASPLRWSAAWCRRPC